MQSEILFQNLQALKALIILKDKALLEQFMLRFKEVDEKLHAEMIDLVLKDKTEECLNFIDSKISDLSGLISYEETKVKKSQQLFSSDSDANTSHSNHGMYGYDDSEKLAEQDRWDALEKLFNFGVGQINNAGSPWTDVLEECWPKDNYIIRDMILKKISNSKDICSIIEDSKKIYLFYGLIISSEIIAAGHRYNNRNRLSNEVQTTTGIALTLLRVVSAEQIVNQQSQLSKLVVAKLTENGIKIRKSKFLYFILLVALFIALLLWFS